MVQEREPRRASRPWLTFWLVIAFGWAWWEVVQCDAAAETDPGTVPLGRLAFPGLISACQGGFRLLGPTVFITLTGLVGLWTLRGIPGRVCERAVKGWSLFLFFYGWTLRFVAQHPGRPVSYLEVVGQAQENREAVWAGMNHFEVVAFGPLLKLLEVPTDIGYPSVVFCSAVYAGATWAVYGFVRRRLLRRQGGSDA